MASSGRLSTAKHIFTVLKRQNKTWQVGMGIQQKGVKMQSNWNDFKLYLKERQKVYWCKETQKQRATGKFCVSFWAAFLQCLKVGVTRGKNLVFGGSCNFRAHKWAIFTTSWPARSKISSFLRVSHISRTYRSEIDFWTTMYKLNSFFCQIKMPVSTLVYDITKGLQAKF